MLYARKNQHAELCVLRVNPGVLDLPGVVITDSNAASDYTKFRPAPEGLEIVDQELTFAEYWTDSDEIEAYRRKAAKCAEVLVPDQVAPSFIMGLYVSCEEARMAVATLEVTVPVDVNQPLFFRAR